MEMDRYLCEPCGYIYDPQEGDPDNGVAPGTAFADIPEDWVCPVCGLGKDAFVKVEGSGAALLVCKSCEGPDRSRPRRELSGPGAVQGI